MALLMRILPDSVRIDANNAIMIRGGIDRFANWQCQGWRNTQMISVGGYARDIADGAHAPPPLVLAGAFVLAITIFYWMMVSPAGFEPATY
jgi:hypothetical protein